MIQEEIKKGIDLYYKKAKELGDYLTEHPEISGQEENSSRYIMGFLEKQGYEILSPYGTVPYSFLAVDKKRRGDKGKKAAFLCEYDALPGVGHACGHSFSCAISILGALALREACPDMPIRIDLIGTPGEEFVGGKCYMAKEGCFDGYEYGAMIHLNNEDETCFQVLASNDRYFTFRGKAAHASSAPEKGLNALNGARIFMEAMDMWRQHLTKDCQFHGIVVKGGTAPNIVPDEVCLDYYYRAGTIENLWKLNKISEECAKGAAIATGTTVECQQRYPDYGEIYWNNFIDQLVRKIFEKTGRTPSSPSDPAGSSDVGNVSMCIPVFHPMLDITGGRKDIVLHDRKFEEILHTKEMERALKDGGRILAELAWQLASHPETMEKIKKDHALYRSGN